MPEPVRSGPLCRVCPPSRRLGITPPAATGAFDVALGFAAASLSARSTAIAAAVTQLLFPPPPPQPTLPGSLFRLANSAIADFVRTRPEEVAYVGPAVDSQSVAAVISPLSASRPSAVAVAAAGGATPCSSTRRPPNVASGGPGTTADLAHTESSWQPAAPGATGGTSAISGGSATACIHASSCPNSARSMTRSAQWPATGDASGVGCRASHVVTLTVLTLFVVHLIVRFGPSPFGRGWHSTREPLGAGPLSQIFPPSRRWE